MSASPRAMLFCLRCKEQGAFSDAQIERHTQQRCPERLSLAEAAEAAEVSTAAFRSAVRRTRQGKQDAPQPRWVVEAVQLDVWVDAPGEYWDRADVEAWAENRPGAGARTDLTGEAS